MMFEKKMLRRICEHKRDEVIGSWRKMHNEELHNLYFSPNIIKVTKSTRLRRAGGVLQVGGIRNVFKISVGKPEGKRPLGRNRYRWKDNIKIDLMDIGWEDVDWIYVAHNNNWWFALVNRGINIRVP
jgi:hypothetical protein